MDIFSWELLGLLFAAASVAGFIDSIAGGGGLIALPALLAAGLTPAQALATNKLQGSFGTMAATWNFYRKGHLKLVEMWPAVLMTFIGSASGTELVKRLDPSFLSTVMPFLLIVVVIYFVFQPKIGETDRHHRISLWGFAFLCGFTIGFYDGFFGPGTGSFFAIAFVTLLGFNLLKATAHTKLLNFTSNIASLCFFILGGKVVWVVGLTMAMGQFIGGYLGSHMTMKHGARIVRPLLITVSLAMTVKLVYSNPDHPIHQWLLALFN